MACKFGFDEIAEMLIDKSESSDLLLVASQSHEFPIHVACKNKTEKYALVKKMLEKVRDYSMKKRNNHLHLILEKCDTNGQNILHMAVNNNHLNITELLLKDYYVNKELKEDKAGNFPIHLAAKNGMVEMFNILKQNDAITFTANNDGETPIHIAASNNKPRFLREFLNYEAYMIEHKDEIDPNSQTMPCVCGCSMLDNHKALVTQSDTRGYTPFHTAIVSCSQKCMDELIKQPEVNISARDKDGNSVFHLCTEFDNIDTFKHLMQMGYATPELLYSKNNHDETLLHLACKIGNLEIIKLVLNQLNESNQPMDSYLFAKNRDGQTCFHVACVKGYLNIIEYFLKERKLKLFLEDHDNNLNSCLHLATENGHSSVVNLLLDFNVDFMAKNEENITALDLSCRKGFFEISKSIVNYYPFFNENEKINEFPLHTACYEGAHEVVKLILEKGTPVDQLDHQNRNCLDIAIERGHREVIRVLLTDPNWAKLIRLTNKIEKTEKPKDDDDEDGEDQVNGDEDDKKLEVVVDKKMKDNVTESGAEEAEEDKEIECPEFSSMFDHKMWDVYKLILDKCVTEKEVDFSIIDPPVKSMSKHPLMLIARSGQENLLKHETTRMLLHLKWRIIPRCAFYFNIGVYMFFMLLFSIYSVDLSVEGNRILEENAFLSSYSNVNKNFSISSAKNELFQQTKYKLNNYNILLTILLIFMLLKETLQIMFLDGLSYFLQSQNIIEIFTYTISLLSLWAPDYQSQSAYGSIAVLSAFILFPLFIQKLKVFGLYVVAFRRTLTNSAKFFPIFLIIFTGFILSFRIRSNHDVNFFNTTEYSIIRTLTMVVGEMDTAKMGLYDGSITNYLIYLLFIGLMCTIVLNLFVGIAVGEIKTVLDEADIQQISMRIVFVLKVQSALIPFQKTFLKHFLNMSFSKYSLESESRLAVIRSKIWSKTKDLFSNKEHTIKLSDPQKRLEDAFNEMARNTDEAIKSIKFGFVNQISDTETRLYNSQIKLQDSIIELTNLTNLQIAQVREENNQSHKNVVSRLGETRSDLEQSIQKLASETDERLTKMNTTFNDQLVESEDHICKLNNRIQNILVDFSNKTQFQFESTKDYSTNQTKNFKQTVMGLQDSIEESFHELTKTNREELEAFEKSFVTKFDTIQTRFSGMESSMVENERRFSELIGEFSNRNESLFREVRNMELALGNLTSLVTDLHEKIKK